MTQEDKDLLIKDLCSRLPYKVKIEITWWVMGEGTYIDTTLEPDHIEQLLNDKDGYIEIRPHLRSMSSMTEEEEKEYDATFSTIKVNGHYDSVMTYKTFDWLNKKMFDYRGLIDKGLALEAPEGMYGKEEEK